MLRTMIYMPEFTIDDFQIIATDDTTYSMYNSQSPDVTTGLDLTSYTIYIVESDAEKEAEELDL